MPTAPPVRNVVDMGYSTVYGAHVSWSSPTRPVPRETRPQAAFDRLFQRHDDKTVQRVGERIGQLRHQ